MKSAAGLRELLVILFKYKYRIVLVLLFTVATVAIGTMMTTPIYEASSVLMVKFGREYVYLEIGDKSATPYNYFNREGIINAEIEILMSRELQVKCINTIGIDILYPDLREKAPKDLPIMDAAMEKFGKNLTAQGSPNPGLIHLSFRHSDPQIAVRTVNLLVDLFKEKHLMVFGDPATASFLVEKLNTYKSRLEETEKEIEAFKRKYETFSLKEQQRLLLAQRSELELALKANQTQIMEYTEKLASLEKQKKARSVSGTIYSEAEIKRNNEVYRGIEDSIVVSQSGLSSHKAKTAVISGQIKELNKALLALTDSEKELQSLERELAINDQNYRVYEKKVEEARIQDEMNRLKLTNIRVVQEASASQKPVLPRKELNIPIGVIVGLLGGLGIAVFQQYLNQGFNTRESVENRLDLPVLSAISCAAVDVREEIVELYHSINALLPNVEKKTILFIGSHEKEGTTTLVNEFAQSTARTFGKSVLLFDADFSPSSEKAITKQHQKLLSYVEAGLPIEYTVGKTEPYTISVCKASNLGIDLPFLFSSIYFARFMDKLKERFDLILIDSPSVAASAYGLAMAARVDGVILVVEAEKTRWPVAKNVKEKLVKSGGNIIGVILNKQQHYIPSFIYRRL